MYLPRTDGLTKERIQHGDISLLVSLLEQADQDVTLKLKADKTETRFHQGASYIIDTLLLILK